VVRSRKHIDFWHCIHIKGGKCHRWREQVRKEANPVPNTHYPEAVQ